MANSAAVAEISTEDLLKRIKDLESQLSKPKAPPPMSLKVSTKGGVSVYGLQRFPVTLYAEQWERILENADKIRVFIAANERKLDRKGEGDAG